MGALYLFLFGRTSYSCNAAGTSSPSLPQKKSTSGASNGGPKPVGPCRRPGPERSPALPRCLGVALNRLEVPELHFRAFEALLAFGGLDPQSLNLPQNIAASTPKPSTKKPQDLPKHLDMPRLGPCLTLFAQTVPIQRNAQPPSL